MPFVSRYIYITLTQGYHLPLQPATLVIVNENYYSEIGDDNDYESIDGSLNNIISKISRLQDYLKLTWSMSSLHTTRPPSPSSSSAMSFDSFV